MGDANFLKEKMKAAIFNPYLDTLGGGERYTFAFAEALVELGYKVNIQWFDKSILVKAESRFNRKLRSLNIVPELNKGDGHDLCFWVSDGSIPLLRARKNLIHFQFPFRDVDGKSLMNKMKLFRINDVICNSEFTKSFIDKEFGVNSLVLYPPVDTKKFKPKKKVNTICFVGRYSQLTQHKAQDVLVDVFIRMIKGGLKDTRLILVGGSEVGAKDYLKDLKNQAVGYPIDILENVVFNELVQIVGQAKIFWSASGYGINERSHPLKVEHFGIAPVEAMSAGCVPILYKAGGHKELVENHSSGLLWSTKKGLIKKTYGLLNNYKKWKSYSDNAKKRAEKYSYESFIRQVETILK